jgi:hypothetical protein
MTRTIGIGIIGMGWMGEVHSRAYRAVRDRFHDCGIEPRLVVCAGAVEARAQAAQQRFGYDDLKTIEAYNFLQSVVTGQQGAPGFAEALAVANVQQAMLRSWTSECWESVER